MKSTRIATLASVMAFSPLTLWAASAFTLSISTPTPAVADGSPVNVIVSMSNMLDHDIVLHERNRVCDYELVVTDQQGSRALEKPLKTQMACSSANVSVGRDIIIVLKPGQSTQETVCISDIDDLSAPGVYTIQLQRVVPKELGSGVAKSNVITVTVTK